jgi:peptidoglycan/LPS O-acetylase OafA/YrhL
MNKLLNSLQRITSSNKFIPEIDGLRFVAISAVVLFHINGFLYVKNQNPYIDSGSKEIINSFLAKGYLGVELFFVISGLILSMPFAAHYINKSEKPDLKSYFLRRLSRLEPPYILALLVLFTALIFMGKYTIANLLPSLLASLTYTHNFFYPGMQPIINAVAWSLEIEVQFYIIAPILAMVFKLNKKYRRLIIILTIISFTIIQNYVRIPSIIQYIQYFGIGFLLTDLIISKHEIKINNFLSFLLGLISFILIWYYEPPHVNGITLTKLLFQLGLILSIFSFYYFALFTKFWKKVFSVQILTVIGGMCYSIYLIHYPIISMIGNPIVKKLHLSKYFLFDYVIYIIIFLITIMAISIGYFKFIEQPCMKKDWYKKFLNKLQKSDYKKEVQIKF